MTATVNLIASGGEGHQEEFEAVFSAVLADHGARLTRNAGEAVADFFPTLDQDLARFVVRSISNAPGSRRTVGVFFRPRQCFLRTRIKYLVKDILFRTLKRLPNVAIVSDDCAPSQRRFADPWRFVELERTSSIIVSTARVAMPSESASATGARRRRVRMIAPFTIDQ